MGSNRSKLKKYNVVDLFCGAGGFSLGLKDTNRFNSILANDIDMDSLSITLDDSFDYPDWVTLECEPCRLMGNAPDEGNYHFPLLINDGSTTVSDTFNLESRYFQPRITSVDDVPEDEGGRVYIEFQRSFFVNADQNNQFYTIFRLDQVEDSTLWVSTVTGTAGGDESYVFEVSTVVDSSGEDNGCLLYTSPSPRDS